MALVAAAAIGVYMYVRMDDEIRRHIEAMLAERYPQLNVSVGGARIVEGRGIAVYDLALSEPGAAGRDGPLVLVDELMLVCKVELASLVQGAPDVRRVEVKHPQLLLRQAANGRWNFESLLPLKPCGVAPPQVVVRDGVASIADASTDQPLLLREIQLTIDPTAPPSGEGAWPSFHVDGTIGGPHLRRAEIHAAVDGATRHCTASMALDDVQIGAPVMAWIRPHLPPTACDTALTGLVDGKVSLAWTCGSGGPPEVHAALALHDARVDDPRLPQPLTDVAGAIAVDGDQQTVEQLHGKCGAAALAINVNRIGWGPAAEIALSGSMENLPLDEGLYQALVTTGGRGDGFDARFAHTLREQWDHYRPTGVVDGTLQARFDGVTWKPTARLAGRQLSFESDKFAYRLTDGAGTIDFTPPDDNRPALLAINIVATGGGQPLSIVGEVVDPRPLAAGWVAITGDHVEIEKRMIDGLEPKPREVIASLNPSGRFNFGWRIERPAPGAPPRTSLRMELVDVRINYDKFPYPVRRIYGTVLAEENQWTFQNLESTGRPTIRCNGTLGPGPQGSELSLQITADGAPLNEELFDALPLAVQHAWQELQPRGEIDLTTTVNYRTGQPKPNITAVIRPRRESAQFRPTFFPYLMEQVAGTITYEDGNVTLANLEAHHDRTTIRTNGAANFAVDGAWNVQLTGLTVDRLAPAQDLLSALPKQLGKLIDRLRPTGNFWLSNGALSFRKPASEIAPLETEWDVQLDCHQTDLQCGIDLQNIHGAVRLRGRSDGVRSYSGGELALETVTFQDVQFTNVRGPLWMDETRCLLGRSAASQLQQAERHLNGTVYGGSAAIDAWVTFDNLPSYSAQAQVVGADLNRVVVERMGSQQQFGGKLDAELRVDGNGYKVESLVGAGAVHIRDADIGELSLLVSLLKVLKRGKVDTSAFNQCEIAFQLQGRHIYLKQVDFLGDVVNLYGVGETDFDQQLKLVFSPSVGRSDFYFPMIKNLVGQANGQIMKMYVTGSLAQPQVTREAFPGINQMLQQIRADLEDPTAAAAQRQAQRAGVYGTLPGVQ